MRLSVIPPMLATLVAEPFDRPGWVYEEKYDGIRVMAYRRGHRVRLATRNLKDVTTDFPTIASAIAGLPDGDLVLDGEIVAFDRDDVSRFQLLQRRALGESIRPVYVVFDCLERGGKSLLDTPLRERRRALWMRSRRLPHGGLEAYRTACRKGWEGIVAKDESSAYEPGRRSRAWLKVKCRKQSEFVIGGFTAPRGRRPALGALLVGLYDQDRLRYTGKVGTGFSTAMLVALGARLGGLRTKAPPFEPPPREADVTWVRPKLVAEIAFAEWTHEGKLRQPVFLGLRDDKRPEECTWDERER